MADTYKAIEFQVGVEVVCARCETGRCAVHDKAHSQARFDGVFVILFYRRRNDRAKVLVVWFCTFGGMS